MFRLEESHEFEWPVEIRKPVGVDPQRRPRYESHRIVVTFRALPLDEAAGAMEESGDAPREPLMQRVIVAWQGVHDSDGEALPCTPDNVARLTRIGYVGAALTEAYFRALTGRAEKN
ncbi:MAG: hypothetical protein OXC28_07115 [Defluviicoccus sp.]|nr:hypothetical protein [Defluviicoccus sp.]